MVCADLCLRQKIICTIETYGVVRIILGEKLTKKIPLVWQLSDKHGNMN